MRKTFAVPQVSLGRNGGGKEEDAPETSVEQIHCEELCHVHQKRVCPFQYLDDVERGASTVNDTLREYWWDI